MGRKKNDPKDFPGFEQSPPIPKIEDQKPLALEDKPEPKKPLHKVPGKERKNH